MKTFLISYKRNATNLLFHRWIAGIVFTFLLASGCLPARHAEVPRAGAAPDSIIAYKAFPFYDHIARNREFADVVKKDAVFRKQTERQAKRIRIALEQCADVACYAGAAQWSPEEIDAIGKRLAQLCQQDKRMRRLPAVLRSAEHYALYRTRPDPDLIGSVWNDAAAGVNSILDIYVKGKKPRYPAIDSISFQVDDPAFRERVRQEMAALVKQNRSKDLFFGLPLQLALRALASNGRDESARYEPLNQGMNKTAVESIPRIQWASFPYSVILVPGQGPEQEGQAIDPTGIQRCRLAAEKYRKRLAPLIVVSGGHVHPNKTPYCEAVEMKKYMVRELQIPESAILIEPHARHTTTNIRNTARMVYRFGIPDTMKILTVTDPIQNSWIPKMEKRFLDELGYLPYRDLKMLTAEENEFHPVRDALQANPLDPLDP